MSQPLDLSQFPDLPPEVVKAFAAQKAALEAAQFEARVERAARQHEQAVVAEKNAFITELKALIEKLEGQVQDYRRTKFGPKSEKLDPAQLELALEDLETAIAETQAQIAAVEDRIVASEPDPSMRKPRAPRKARALPESLPRVERVLERGSPGRAVRGADRPACLGLGAGHRAGDPGGAAGRCPAVRLFPRRRGHCGAPRPWRGPHLDRLRVEHRRCAAAVACHACRAGRGSGA